MKRQSQQVSVPRRCRRVSAAGLCGVAVLLMLATDVVGQTDPMVIPAVPVDVDSGVVDNTTGTVTTVFSTVIQVPEAVWVRLDFDEVLLAGDIGAGTASTLRMTSLADGGYQVMNATHVAQWHHSSAYFNGDSVKVEVIAHPHTGPNRLVISEVTIGVVGADGGERTICDGVDDRTFTTDRRVGRGRNAAGEAKCTAFIINDCQHCLLSAGHCEGHLNPAGQIHFNVPKSTAAGTPVMSNPNDQYAIDVTSWSFTANGSGDDWSYFGCFPNPTTGLTPYQAQWKSFAMAMPPAASEQVLRVTGYGVTSAPVNPNLNRALKKDTGPYTSRTGSNIAYRVDTTSGNSGSPVMLEGNPDAAFAIHESGGCGAGGAGANHGTGLNNAGLQAALAAPKGVCTASLEVSVVPNPHACGGCGPGATTAVTLNLTNNSGGVIDVDWTSAIVDGGCVTGVVPPAGTELAIAAGATRAVTVTLEHDHPGACPGTGAQIDFAGVIVAGGVGADSDQLVVVCPDNLTVRVVPNPHACGGACGPEGASAVTLELTNGFAGPIDVDWTGTVVGGVCVTGVTPALGAELAIAPGTTRAVAITLDHNHPGACPGGGAQVDFVGTVVAGGAGADTDQLEVVCEPVLGVSVVPNPHPCGGACGPGGTSAVTLELSNHSVAGVIDVTWTSAMIGGGCVTGVAPVAGVELAIAPGETRLVPITLDHDHPDECPGNGAVIGFVGSIVAGAGGSVADQLVVMCDDMLGVTVVPNPHMCGGACGPEGTSGVTLQLTNGFAGPIDVDWTSAIVGGGCVTGVVPATGTELAIASGETRFVPIKLEHNHPDACPGTGALIDFAAVVVAGGVGSGDEQLVVLCPGLPIPTLSEWGLIAMTLLGLSVGTIVFSRRRRAPA